MIFVDLTLPFAAVTTDGATARPHIVRDGPLLPALLASAAIPGIFPSVDLDGRQLRRRSGGQRPDAPSGRDGGTLVGGPQRRRGWRRQSRSGSQSLGASGVVGMRECGQQHRDNITVPVRSATSLNNPTLACDTTPRTSADTATPVAALRYASPRKCLPARIIGTAKGLIMPCRTGTAAYLHPASPAIARRIQVRRLSESNYQSP